MNFEFLLEKASGVGSLWWLPLLFWIAYFFVSRYWDYPAELEKHIQSGKYWPYLPKFWQVKKKFIRIGSLLLVCCGSLFCACSLYYLFPYGHFILLIIGFALSMFVTVKIRDIATKDIIRWQQDRYFQIYTQFQKEAVSRGDEISDSSLVSKAQWKHHNDLRLADKQGRLIAFLKGEAKL